MLLTDPDPAATRAMAKVFAKLPPSHVETICNITPAILEDFVNDIKRDLDNKDYDGAWRHILEAKYIRNIQRLCPSEVARPVGVFDSNDIPNNPLSLLLLLTIPLAIVMLGV
ncbi:MAG: hypothetical protein QXO37_06975 [Candidatus Nitrosocaldaceae archaeon]